MLTKFASGRFCSKACSDIFCKTHINLEQKSRRMKEAWKDPEKRHNLISGQQRSQAAGTWPPMMTNRKKSYAEQYWEQVLQNSGVEYTYNYLVKHSDLGVVSEKLTWYKLDFYLPKYNLDLEIDGSQHEDQAEHDKIRNSRLMNAGYRVYRIPWKGHAAAQEQIADFIKYLESL